MKRSQYILAASLLAVLLCGFFLPVTFLGGTFLPVDLHSMLYEPYATEHPVFEPFNHFEDDILRWYYEWKFYARKHLYQPYWSPHAYGGVPWYGTTYASHFCSTNWILPLGQLERTYPLQLLAQLWIAGFGMFVLLSSFRLGFGVSFLHATAFMLSSMMITLLLRWWVVGAFGWVPYLLWATRHWLEGRRKPWLALSSLFLALSFVDGFLQSSATVCLLYAVFCVTWWHWVVRPRQSFRALLLSGLAVTALAFALSAVMWLPTLEYLFADIAKGHSRVGGEVFGKNLLQRALSLPFLISFAMPQLLGSVRALDLAKLINSHLQDFTAFVGSAPLLFGLGAAFSPVAPHMRPFLALVLLGLAVPILTPLDRFFYFRFLMVYTTGICVLGAFGLRAWLEDPTMYVRARQALFALFGVIFLGVVVLNIVFLVSDNWVHAELIRLISARLDLSRAGSQNHDWMLGRAAKAIEHYRLSSATMLVPLAGALAVFLSTRLYRVGHLCRPKLLAALLAVTVTELGFFAYGWLPVNDPREYPLFPRSYVTDFLVENAGPYRVTADNFAGESTRKQILPTNSQVIYGFKTIEGYDGLMPAVVYHVPAPVDDYRKLGLLNVKYILAHPEPSLTDPALTLVKSGVVAIYENKLAKPRGRIVYDYEIVAQEAVQARLAASDYDGSQVFFAKEPPVKIREQRPPGEDVRILSEDDNEITYTFRSERPGYFVASETWYPGWKAWLDDQPVEILRANYAMRAVPIPAGEHRLRFFFDPPIYNVGLAISTAGFLIFLTLVSVIPTSLICKARPRLPQGAESQSGAAAPSLPTRDT